MLIASLCINAKEPPADLGYDPPEGWEFVMKLDSAGTFNLHCHNDTCFLASSLYTTPYRFIYAITTNGGETWEDIPSLPAPRIFIKNSNTLHRVMLEGSNFYYEKSYDFYSTKEKYLIGKSPYYEDTLYHSPIDTNILIATFKAEYEDDFGKMTDMLVKISRDAGKTWETFSNLYRHPENMTFYSFNFDWAEKCHWFVRAEDGEDVNGLITPISPPVYFETFDDGKTLREIKFDPVDKENKKKLIGVDGFKTIREGLLYFANGITVYKYDDTISLSEYNDWIYNTDPTKPKTNLDSGYRRAFSFLDGYYQFDNFNFNNIFLPIYEHIGDIRNFNYIIKTYFYTTVNNGESWTLLNDLGQKPHFIHSVLDQRTKTLWIHVKDEEFQRGKNNSSYKGSLWKLKLPWESTSVNDISVHKSGFVIYPNPADDFITIQFSNKELQLFAAGDKVQIYDVLGIEVGQSSLIDNTSHNNSQSGMSELLKIDVSHLPAGVYFIRIGNKVEKFVKI